MKLPSIREFLGRPLYWFAAAVFVATIFLPPRGFGDFSLCSFKNLTGVSCFGCGMTRSVTSLTHFKPALAWGFHPFGFLLWPLMLLLAAGSIPKFGLGIEKFAKRHDRSLTAMLWICATAFLLFGFARLFFGEAFWLA